ncbi:MAG: hydroxymethylbilane synthase [Candidatus Bathyarchaeia archaeon]
MRLIVGTRGSRLSLAQTESVVDALTRNSPNIKIQTKIIETTGDRLESAPLKEIYGKGVFEKEVDEAIVKGEVDFAVHSMKDVPAEQPEGLTIAAVPRRAPPNDVLVSQPPLRLHDLPPGAKVGTSSPRRIAELLRIRPDLKPIPIRGNVDTRIRKLDAGDYDAIILAEAGLTRLSMKNRIVDRLSLEEFTPAPGQGFLAVVARRDRVDVLKLLDSVNNPESLAEAVAERAFMNEVGGGCKIPLGAFAQAQDGTLNLFGSVISPDGSKRVDVKEAGTVDRAEAAGRAAAKRIMKMGAAEIVRSWTPT